MTESATSKLCSEKINPEIDLIPNLKQEFPSEDDLNVDENRIACINCKVEVDEIYVHNEVYPLKEEFAEDAIKNEDTADVPSHIEEFNILYCYQCSYSSNDKQNLTDHVFTHRFKCNRCNYTTVDNYMLMTHQQICNSCVKVDLLDERMYTHSSEIGEKAASQPTQVKIECLSPFKHKEKLFKCSFCDYSTKRRYNLKIHANKHSCFKSRSTENEEKQLPNFEKRSTFGCKNCDYKTEKKDNLKMHARIHAEIKQFKCNFCSFSTKWLTNLKLHSNKHSGARERNLCCDECEYKTYSKSHLIQHKRIHSEERPFKCSLCDFSCKQSPSLRAHLKNHGAGRRVYKKRVHPEGNIFKCSLCDFVCKKSLNFTQHLNDHSAQRNFTFVQKTYSKLPSAKTF